jgi:ribosomal protein S2
MNVIISDFFEAGVHLGYSRRGGNPKSNGFVYSHRIEISIIDMEKHLVLLARFSRNE